MVDVVCTHKVLLFTAEVNKEKCIPRKWKYSFIFNQLTNHISQIAIYNQEGINKNGKQKTRQTMTDLHVYCGTKSVACNLRNIHFGE